jgi:hypothetical protein
VIYSSFLFESVLYIILPVRLDSSQLIIGDLLTKTNWQPMKHKDHLGDLIVVGSWFVVVAVLGAILVEMIQILRP